MGITLEEALENTMKLSTFLLKISKVSRKEGVNDINLCLFKDSFVATLLLDGMSLLDRIALVFPLLFLHYLL
jgi:hypothetical protein